MSHSKHAKNAIIIGATGLVGRFLLAELATQYQHIIAIVRKKPDIKSENTPIHYHLLADFTHLADALATLHKDHDLTSYDAYSTLGTTQKVAGSKANFYAVDFGFNHAFASNCAKLGVKRFILLSSIGADATHKLSFYLKTKGKLENAIQQLNFDAYYVFQPSLLIGHHQGRFAESLGQRLFAISKPLIPDFYQYRPIEAQRVAKAMVNFDKASNFDQSDKNKPDNADKNMLVIANSLMLKMTKPMTD